MSGHSKWSTIKRKKAKEDAKRGMVFTKISKEISVAARLGGGDPTGNSRLRLLIEKAKELNMPKENTERAIKKGTGELPGIHYESITYEGYGPYGIAVLVDTLTDNKNRTVSDMRRLFSSNGGNLTEGGAVSWIFEKQGVIRILDDDLTEDELLEKLIDYDIFDISKDSEESIFSVTCGAKSLMQIKNAIKNDTSLKIESADLDWVPKTSTKLSEDQADKAYHFLEILHDHDDVQNVYTNLTQ